jgi:hypothetical protein
MPVFYVDSALPAGMDWCRKAAEEVGRVGMGEFALVKAGQLFITSLFLWHAGLPSVLEAMDELSAYMGM